VPNGTVPNGTVIKARSSGKPEAAQVPSHQAKYLDVRYRKANKKMENCKVAI